MGHKSRKKYYFYTFTTHASTRFYTYLFLYIFVYISRTMFIVHAFNYVNQLMFFTLIIFIYNVLGMIFIFDNKLMS